MSSDKSLEEPKFPSSSTVYDDDIDELEVTEMDAAILRDLLEESGETEPETVNGTADDHVSKVEPHHLELEPPGDCLKEQYEAPVHDNWLRTMENMTPSLPSDDGMDWYLDSSMEEMIGMIDFGDDLQFYIGVSFDEAPYSSFLWQDY